VTEGSKSTGSSVFISSVAQRTAAGMTTGYWGMVEYYQKAYTEHVF